MQLTSVQTILECMDTALNENARLEAKQSARDAHWAALLRTAQTGDGDAFGQFYQESGLIALSVVRRVVGDGWAEDVLADAYVQAWHSVQGFDPERGSACSWLLTICRSRALDKLRFEKLRSASSLDGTGAHGLDDSDAPSPSQQVASDAPDPCDLLSAMQSRQKLHLALADLSANERWVLGLAYFKDMSHIEIAAATALPLGTVKSLANRAQKKLRLALELS